MKLFDSVQQVSNKN